MGYGYLIFFDTLTYNMLAEQQTARRMNVRMAITEGSDKL